MIPRRKDAAGPAGPLLVIAGMKREAACVAGKGVVTLCSGANVAILKAELAKLQDQNFSGVVSFGLAGGLDYALRPGDIVVADAVLGGGQRYATDATLNDVMLKAVAAGGGKAARGALVGVDEPAMNVAAKTHLRETHNAIAVDMESHLAAQFAQARKLRFATLRAISDPAARALPPLAANALTPSGDVDGMKVARELLRAPGQIGDLIFAGLDSRAAFAALGRCGLLLGPLARLMFAGL